MAKKAAKTKKKKAAKKDSAKKDTPAQPAPPAPPVQPAASVKDVPAPPPVLPGLPEDKKPVLPEVQTVFGEDLNFTSVRQYVADKVALLQYWNQPCPVTLQTDVDKVLVWLQLSDISGVVKHYVRLSELLRYWSVYCDEQARNTERTRKRHQRTLTMQVRANAAAAAKKMTVNDVEAEVRTNTEHEQLLILQETWEFLGKQIQQISMSMQTEMLVQSSVWTQHELGVRATVPGGAVG